MNRPASIQAAPSGGPARVLVVDDDPNQARLIAWNLGAVPGKPYAVDSVLSFDEGATAVDAGTYDAYIVDQRLGQARGTDLIERARAQGSTAAMVVMTAHRDADSDAAALRAGADDFLIKGETDWKLLDRTLRYVLRIARDRTAMERSRAHIAALEQIGTLLSDEGLTPEALAGTLEIIGSAFGYGHLAIYLMEDGVMRAAGQVGYPQVNPVIEASGLIGQVMRSGIARFIPNASIDPDFRGAGIPASELCVPLTMDHQPIGVLLAGSASTAPLGETAHAVILNIGQRIALAATLDRERRELQARNRRFQHLARFARVATDLPDWTDDGAAALLDVLVAAVPSEGAAIVDLGPDGTLSRASAVHGADPRLVDGAAELLERVLGDGRSAVEKQPGHLLTAVPVALHGRLLAVILLDRHAPLSTLERELMPLLAAGIALRMSASTGRVEPDPQDVEDPDTATLASMVDLAAADTALAIGVIPTDAVDDLEAISSALAPGERLIDDGRGTLVLVLPDGDAEHLRARMAALFDGHSGGGWTAGGSAGHDPRAVLTASRGALALARRSGRGLVVM